MRFVLIVLILGLLVAFSGCLQPESGPQVKVKETAASEEWKPDGVVGANEYARSMLLQDNAGSGYSGGKMQISWKNDAEYLCMALNGSTRGWISIGFQPTDWMKDADIIMAFVERGRVTVLDQNCTGNYGPHENDTMLGGTYDILDFGGREGAGFTVVEFRRRMNTGDRLDRAFVPGQKVSMIWAMANSSSDGIKHNVAKGEGTLELQ
jgi:hypothetical protein